MRKVILMLLLSVANSSAMAEWANISTLSDGNLYVDTATIRFNGNRVKLWCLVDYKTAKVVDGKSYLSRMQQHEYNCKEEKFRVLYSSIHTGTMRKGEVVLSSNVPQKWTPVSPGSAEKVLLKIACGE